MTTTTTISQNTLTEQAKKSTLYLPALTGLRAIAAYMVFFVHYNPFPKGGLASRLTHEGHIGVTIFFVLSGFLICLRYIDRLELSRHWLKRYMLNRVARIYPMYALITALTFLAIRLDNAFELTGRWESYSGMEKKVLVPLLNFTFLRSFFKEFLFSGVAPGWTLTVEEVFYLSAPLLLLGLLHTKKRYLTLVLYAAVLLGIGCIAVAVLPHVYGLMATYKFMLNFTFFGRCIEFMVGMALALFVRQRGLTTSKTYFTWLGVAWILLCMYGLTRVDVPADNIDGSVSSIGIAINNALLPIGIAALFYGLIYESTWLRRLLETDLFKKLGQSSYTFYLIHMGVIGILIDRLVTTNYMAHFFILIGLSWLLFKYVEEPLHKRIAALGKK